MTPKHIQTFVFHFYQKIQRDTLLSPIFNDVAQINWNEHLPSMCRFWNSIVFKIPEYHGNVYHKHVNLGKKVKIDEIHFKRWLQLFQETALIHLPIQNAQQIITKAHLIAQSLKIAFHCTDSSS